MRDGEEPVLFVKDDGIGIAPEHREAIFGIFRRLHGRDSYGGSLGAGLAIVRRIVEQQGGRIWVESTLREGSTFLFSLPIAARSAQGPPDTAPQPQRTAPHRPCISAMRDA